MNDFTITMWACGFLVTLISTTFGVFWKIILGVENRLTARMTETVQEREEYEKENNSKHDLLFSKHDMLLEKSHNFMTYKDASDSFVKKEIHDLQFQNVMTILAQMNGKIDKIVETKG